MIFNSIEFLLFLPIVFAFYWYVARFGVWVQNLTLLVASYVFYGWWDVRFLALIALSSAVDFLVAKRIASAREKMAKLAWLGLSLAVNLGCLAYFKYCNFFIESWNHAMSSVGLDASVETLSIILPVGISFYTFQTLSYSIDVYRGKLEPTKSALEFFTFVSFFPQLVAGPIERASELLPQIQRNRFFDYEKAVVGVRLIFWGMVKKVLIGDTCGFYANKIFSGFETLSAATLCLGAVYFAIQIYCDFSGYSDIAIGTARLFGIKLSTNFRTPYFSKSIPEFWRRWHISLSSWFRDYLYIPLGGSRVSQLRTIVNVLVVFLVSGFWHGANWTFIVWGAIHGLLFVPSSLLQKKKRAAPALPTSSRIVTRCLDILRTIRTFALVCIAWVFFRSPDVSTAISYLSSMSSFSGPSGEWLNHVGTLASVFVAGGFLVDWVLSKPELAKRIAEHPLYRLRFLGYFFAAWMCLKRFHNGTEFIYFQF